MDLYIRSEHPDVAVVLYAIVCRKSNNNGTKTVTRRKICQMSITRLTAEESVLMAPTRRELWEKKNMAVQLISAEKSMGEKIKPVRAGFSHLESLQQQNEGDT